MVSSLSVERLVVGVWSTFVKIMWDEVWTFLVKILMGVILVLFLDTEYQYIVK